MSYPPDKLCKGKFYRLGDRLSWEEAKQLGVQRSPGIPSLGINPQEKDVRAS